MVRPLRIRIVGGSIAGLFAAILLDRQGMDVRIYERSGADLSGRGAGLTGGRELFDAIHKIGCSNVSRLSVLSDRQVMLDQQGGVVADQPASGSRFSWDLLYRTARAKLSDNQYVQGRHVVRVEHLEDGAAVVFKDGEQERADLVIGADGVASVVRQLVDPDHFANDYAGYAAWRILLPEQQLPQGLSSMRNALVAFSWPGIQSIGYMVPGGAGEIEPGRRRYSWGWYRPASARELTSLFTTADGHRFEYSLPPGSMSEERVEEFRRDAAALLPPQFAEITQSEHRPWIQGIFDYLPRRLVAGRVVLLGDAGALARPHVGMGTSKAAGDAVALATALGAAGTIGEALRAFERDRLASAQWLVMRSREIGASLRLAG
ncbi:2-polyprenyl-6-methoxyphenol hydroxylase [Sphingobium sp. AP50]|uniref:FAD binding domain-containing protein n=1 Tax=Sphingobium sp. AP50 TaxID=1884369 RepID=UPI0008BC2AFE|nr:FAD-dependent monooxygenase [Sphingobium sp. AP50]SEJ82074.1 2-polyprenyl-6-methoxyphenol hydroxylase [Sphingobium sp. AP50]